MRPAASIRMTLLPSSAKKEVISLPALPAPMTAMTLGRRRILMAVSGVRNSVVSTPAILPVLRREPVAKMKLAEVIFLLLMAIV